MRLLTLLPLLAATALATESLSEPSPSTAVPSSEAQTTDDASSSSSSTASAPSASSTQEPTPVGALWTAQWTDADLASYKKRCNSKATLNAEIFKLKEMYPKLKTWAPELKVFYSKQLYPGSWEGIDVHGDQRELLKMRTEDLPFAVREWIKKTPKQRHFSIQEDVAFFAPGAIYPILPLFVDDADEKGCDDVFDDLDSYSPTAKDGAVLGKVSHKKGQKNEIEITIEAFKVEKSAGGRDEL